MNLILIIIAGVAFGLVILSVVLPIPHALPILAIGLLAWLLGEHVGPGRHTH
jgi:hypothetical protein